MQVEDIADRDAEWFVVVVHAYPYSILTLSALRVFRPALTAGE
jgi:hypothetical protein